ncbi:MAG: carbohydrate kinase family protein [Thermoplasmatota archaeon]
MSIRRGILVCGNLNIDRIYSVPELPSAGVSVPIISASVEYGGCGGNIALGCAKLDTDVSLSSVVGRDFDPDYRDRLAAAGIGLEHLIVDPGLPTPTCIIFSAPGGNQAYAFMEGAMAGQAEIDVPLSQEGDLAFCHIATSHPRFARRCSEMLSARGVSVSLDPGQEIFFRWDRGSLEESLVNCHRFFGNLGEWIELGSIMGWDEGPKGDLGIPRFTEAFDLIDESVVTLSEKGSALISRDGVRIFRPHPVRSIVDATGAGDAFRSGFYSAMVRGYSSEEAAGFGNMMGALSLSSRGPQEYHADWDMLMKMRIDP